RRADAREAMPAIVNPGVEQPLREFDLATLGLSLTFMRRRLAAERLAKIGDDLRDALVLGRTPKSNGRAAAHQAPTFPRVLNRLTGFIAGEDPIIRATLAGALLADAFDEFECGRSQRGLVRAPLFDVGTWFDPSPRLPIELIPLRQQRLRGP